MRGIRKLRSRSGATILLAILVFMLCIFVGTAALTAAAANSGRYTHLKAEEQAYLNVSSAAKLFRDEFLGCYYTAEVTTEVTTPAGGTAGTPNVNLNNNNFYAVDPAATAGQIPQKFKDYLDSFIKFKEDENATWSKDDLPDGFTVEYDGNKVDVSVNSPTSAATGLQFKFTFSVGADKNYETVLTMVGTLSYSPPTVSTSPATGNPVTTKTATVSWTEENAHISEAEG